MAKRQAIEVVDRTLLDIIGNSESFGGKVVVFGGDFKQPTEIEDLIKIPDEMVITMKNEGDSEEKLINEIFNGLQHHGHSTKYIAERAILITKNEIVDKLNEMLINFFPRESVTYYSFDSATDYADTQYLEEFLNSLTPNGLPPHK
ncbi:uncharacterized protein LOC122663004 [Telopea speciosissima]|uniref:uncharacterized protein LOC122663004 n=1 Tax=Telopea speciosissima TaxID=54955 RepID=UPI001CC3E363|nr:uncharacterized protein LOC122663004 [Telopea speciosissima]